MVKGQIASNKVKARKDRYTVYVRELQHRSRAWYLPVSAEDAAGAKRAAISRLFGPECRQDGQRVVGPAGFTTPRLSIRAERRS